jgi:hypothetical protein
VVADPEGIGARVVGAMTIAGCAVAALLSCVVMPAGAQPARDSAVQRALSGFTEGELIRIALLRSRWAGVYMGRLGDTLFLGQQDQPAMRVRFNAIDTAWRATKATGYGMRIGAVAGGILGGALIGAGVGTTDGDNAMTAIIVGAAGGLVVGGGTGTLIGSMFRRWRRVFP